MPLFPRSSFREKLRVNREEEGRVNPRLKTLDKGQGIVFPHLCTMLRTKNGGGL